MNYNSNRVVNVYNGRVREYETKISLVGLFAINNYGDNSNHYFNSAIIEIIKATKAIAFETIIGIQK